MTTVYLYGHLGRKFGHRWNLEVSSPAEAVRALIANRPDFEAHLLKHNRPGYHVFIGPDPIKKPDELGYPLGRQAIKIVPVVAGAKDQTLGIIIGVVLIAAAVISQQYQLLPVIFEGMTVATATAINVGVGFMGAGMVVGGVSQLLAGTPKSPDPSTFEEAAKKPSFFFNGPVNTTQQGLPVPVCYGRMRVGSAVISAAIFTEDIA